MSAGTDLGTKGPISTIYVRILGENIDVWCPVEAERTSKDAYRILEVINNSGDQLEFCIGQIVETEDRSDEHGSFRVATKLKID